jgi:hypothetical protein
LYWGNNLWIGHCPLGVGSGFPSTVCMAIAFFILFKKQDHDFIWKLRQYNRAPINLIFQYKNKNHSL